MEHKVRPRRPMQSIFITLRVCHRAATLLVRHFKMIPEIIIQILIMKIIIEIFVLLLISSVYVFFSIPFS